MDKLDITFPQWAAMLFKPIRYKVAYGGRGSGKSHTFTDALLVQSLARPLQVLCAREHQVSIADSVHRLLSKRIEDLGLEGYFTIQRDSIEGLNGSRFIFKGLRHNIANIKSMAGIDVCWIEEAQTISQDSLDTLIPTIREAGSEIWLTLNPRLESDPVYRMFIAAQHAQAATALVNYSHNRHFPAVLEAERLLMLERDPALYGHVWEGQCLSRTDAQVFKDKWGVESFEPTASWGQPYYGLDFGFSQDPTAALRVWVHDDTVWVDAELVQTGLELDHTPAALRAAFEGIEGAVIRADSARPESISYLARHGLPRMKAVKKGKGSVEEGIAHLRSYKRIVAHPRCRHLQEELLLYSYKVDQRSNDIGAELEDKHNHCIDALRYALEPLMRRKLTFADVF